MRDGSRDTEKYGERKQGKKIFTSEKGLTELPSKMCGFTNYKNQWLPIIPFTPIFLLINNTAQHII